MSLHKCCDLQASCPVAAFPCKPMPLHFKKIPFALALLFCGLLPSRSEAQALTLDHAIQTYTSLANTTATLTGRSELRITGTSSPLTACTIHLNSPNSWLLMTKTAPSAVNSTYLSQVRVNGAAAVVNTNCRIVEYGDGAVVIPQSSTFTPLQVFTGPYFTGTSTSLSNYTAYTDANLGIYANNISSFKLKRGYTCTLASNANGSGTSKNYVAQDGDLEISVLPGSLDDTVSFIRVFPWRWISKKGSCDVDPTALYAKWHYNWDINKNSTLDWEYVGIRQQRYWPGLGQDWKARGVSHLLGYNEPNNPVEDSYTSLNNGSTTTAVEAWPDLLATGLRLGAPAVTDAGQSWLYDFINKAEAAGHRVDYVPVHYYRGFWSASDANGAANQMYNFLKAIHDVVQRPIWVTEFNNGANWTSDPDPNVTQQKNTIQAMINMMDDTPWIERYAIYSNVEWMRKTHYDDGNLTPMGQMYRDHSSPIGHIQVIPNVLADASALYQFENSPADSSANGHTGMMMGAAMCGPGHTGQALALSGTSGNADHVLLPPRLGDGTDFTFGGWIYWTGGSNWQRIFDFGDRRDPGWDESKHMFLTPKSSSGVMRFSIKNGSTEQNLDYSGALPTNTWTHVAVTISGNTGKLFINGAPVATNTGMSLNPSALGTNWNYLGKSRFGNDPYFAGKLDDVQFLSYALTDTQVAALVNNLPPQFSSATISGGNATQEVPYTGSIASQVTDANPGDTITFTKMDGPDWLNIAADGTLSGTPTYGDTGTQSFLVFAKDSVGATSRATLTITLPNVLGNGIWSVDAGGTWGDSSKWTANFPANGAGNTADFSTLNITADRTVTLNATRSIGTLKFGDTSGAQNWLLNDSGGSTLNLEVASGNPSIFVNQNTANVSTALTGTQGLAKIGPGRLILSGSSTVSGTLYVDTNANPGDGGTTCAAHPDALDGFSAISIRNNNSGFSTFELDGSTGDLVSPASVGLSGRNNATVAIRNISGENHLNGGTTIGVGGSYYIFESLAGTLNLGGTFTSGGGSSRTLTFQGDGSFTFKGPVTLGSATAYPILKSGAGTLTFSGTGNNFGTGATTLNGGTLVWNGTGTLGTGALTFAAGTALTLYQNLAFTQTVTGPGTIYNSGSCTISGNHSGFTGNYTHDSTFVSTSFASVNATSANASYHIASNQGSIQGLIAGVTSGTNTYQLGALSGVPGSLFRNSLSTTGTNTLQIGNLGTDTEFAGTLGGGGGTLALTKVGTGTLTLSGPCTYNGPTLINAGTLRVNGSTAAASAVTVANNATLSGGGTLGGAVNVLSGGNLSPGADTATLTFSGNLTLQAGANLRLDLNGSTDTCDKLAVTGTLNRGGNLILTHTGDPLIGGETFDLFDAATLTGSFSSVSLPTLSSGLQWNTASLATSGVITVDSIAATYPGWAAAYTFPPGESDPGDDPDGDGLTNTVEWMLGTHPLNSNAAAMPVQTVSGSTLPGADPAKHYLTLSTRIRRLYTGVTIIPQANPDPAQLDTPASEGLVSSYQVQNLGEFEDRVWYYTQALEDTPQNRAFMRLKFVVP